MGNATHVSKGAADPLEARFRSSVGLVAQRLGQVARATLAQAAERRVRARGLQPHGVPGSLASDRRPPLEAKVDKPAQAGARLEIEKTNPTRGRRPAGISNLRFQRHVGKGQYKASGKTFCSLCQGE